MNVTTQDIDAICSLVQDLCGVYLDASKDYLIEARLGQIARHHGCESYTELAAKARRGLNKDIETDIVDAITTHETLWFRDGAPFEALKYKLFPELIDSKAASLFPRRMRVWSAACSTGQEAYSIAMTFADICPDIHNWDLQILGTDVSPGSVARAREASYSELEVSRGLDQKHLSGYFIARGREWQVCDALRKKCKFEVRNLLRPLTGLGPFDVIFCRNVAIYFTDHDRRVLFERLAEVLAPGGWLFVGSSESMTDIGPNWNPYRHCRAACYQPKPLGVPVMAR